MVEWILCLDVGGSHLSAGVVNSKACSVVEGSLESGMVNSMLERKAVLDQWEVVINRSLSVLCGAPVHALCVAMPGPFDYEKGISLMDGMHKYQALLDMDVRKYFASLLSLAPDRIFFVNDAEAFLLGQLPFVKNYAQKRVMGITLGTGLGSALYNQGRVKDLNLGSSLFLEGIAEDYISTRGIIRFYRKCGGDKARDVKSLFALPSTDIYRQQTIEQLRLWMIAFLKRCFKHEKPDVIVIGGNIAQGSQFFLPGVLGGLEHKDDTKAIQVADFGQQNLLKGLALLLNDKN